MERTVDAISRRTGARVVGVHTKIDLTSRDGTVSAVRATDDNARPPVYLVSAERGDGLQALLSALDMLLTGGGDTAADEEPVLVTRERHRLALGQARDEIAQFLEAWAGGIVPATVAAVHLQAARDVLGDVTGVIALDDVLDRVFRDFCIGK